MRRPMLLALLMTGVACTAIRVQAHDRGLGYPRVRTFSGGYYGPTQAHYQYQRRYGRPWHGGGGFFGGAPVGAVNGFNVYHGGYGAVIGGWAFPRYWSYGYATPFGHGAYYRGYPVFPPVYGGEYGVTTRPTEPGWVLPPSPMPPVLSDAWDNNLQQWEQPLDLLPVIPSGKPTLPPSTPAARIRSIQLQQHGDRRLRDLDYLRASGRYRDAISAAADRAEPHLHLAIAFAGMKQFESAVQELKVGLGLDPAWPMSGASLDGLLGAENLIGKMHLKQRVAEWALHDVRDPDRLFLLGALLCLDDDAERGRFILETAARLGGLHEHLAVFLRADPLEETSVASESPAVVAPDLEREGAEIPELPPLPAPPPGVTPPSSGDQPSGASSAGPEFDGPAFPE